MTPQERKDFLASVPDEEWEAATKDVVEKLRLDKGMPDWLPTYLNRSYEFTSHVIKRVQEKREN